MKPKITLVRILGNDLPPRDAKGGRLEALEYILANEPEFPNCRKRWLINSVWDEVNVSNYKEILGDRDWWVLSPDLDRYKKARTRRNKLCAGIRLNEARNKSIDGIMDGEFVFPFDGDVWFNQEDWDKLNNNLVERYRDLDYLFMRCSRYNADGKRLAKPTSEPMIGMRKGTKHRFNPRLELGNMPKVELSRRIQRQKAEPWAWVGHCRHISTGKEVWDSNKRGRGQARKKSLSRFISYLNGLVRAS